MWRFYWRSIRRMPSLAMDAVKRVDTLHGLLTIGVWMAIGGTAAGAWWQKLPSQVPVIALLSFLGYGFLSAVYQEYVQVEQARDKAQEHLATAKRHRVVKELLGDAVDQGKDLQGGFRTKGGKLEHIGPWDMKDWVHRTHDLVEAAFDKGEARQFLNSEDYETDSPMWRIHADPFKYYPDVRLRRRHELIVRANKLPINPDFDPDEWTNG